MSHLQPTAPCRPATAISSLASLSLPSCRRRELKDVGVCYAFVEFEDVSSAHTAIKNSSIEFLGRQVHIDPRKPGSNISSRGGGCGLGRRKRMQLLPIVHFCFKPC